MEEQAIHMGCSLMAAPDMAMDMSTVINMDINMNIIIQINNPQRRNSNQGISLINRRILLVKELFVKIKTVTQLFKRFIVIKITLFISILQLSRIRVKTINMRKKAI